jgi:hypothetical protein
VGECPKPNPKPDPNPNPNPNPSPKQVDSVGEIRALECHVVLLMEYTGTGAAPSGAAAQGATVEVAAKANTEVTMGGSLEM